MPTELDIRKSLENMASQFGPQQTNIARVQSTNMNDFTCTLIDDDDVPIYKVRLLPIVGEKDSIVIIPEDKSLVLCCRIESSDNWMIIRTTKILKIQIIAGGESLATLVKDLIAAIRAMKFTTNMGPTIALLNDATFENIDNRFNKMLF